MPAHLLYVEQAPRGIWKTHLGIYWMEQNLSI